MTTNKTPHPIPALDIAEGIARMCSPHIHLTDVSGETRAFPVFASSPSDRERVAAEKKAADVLGMSLKRVRFYHRISLGLAESVKIVLRPLRPAPSASLLDTWSRLTPEQQRRAVYEWRYGEGSWHRHGEDS